MESRAKLSTRDVLLRIGGLLALFLFFTVIELGMVRYGGNISGGDPPSSQCAVDGRRPTVGGPYTENMIVTGKRTLFPLGITCTYDSPDDTVGPQTVENPKWLDTVVAYGIPPARGLGRDPRDPQEKATRIS